MRIEILLWWWWSVKKNILQVCAGIIIIAVQLHVGGCRAREVPLFHRFSSTFQVQPVIACGGNAIPPPVLSPATAAGQEADHY